MVGALSNFAPSFTQKPKLRQEDDGNKLIFECQLSASPQPEIEWFRGDDPVSEGKRTKIVIQPLTGNLYDVKLTLDDVEEEDQGLYKVKAKNKYGEVSASINLNFSPADQTDRKQIEGMAPTFAQKPVIIQEGAGKHIKFQCRINADPKPAVIWYRDGNKVQESSRCKVTIEKEDSAYVLTLSLTDVTVEDAGKYKVTAKNELGESNANIRLNFDSSFMLISEGQTELPASGELRPAFTERPTIRQSDDCLSIIFMCRCVGKPKPEITWEFKGKKLRDGGRFKMKMDAEGKLYHMVSLEISKVTNEDEGDYKVVAKNKVGEGQATISLSFEGKTATDKPKLKIPDGKAPRFPKKPEIRQEGDKLVMECLLEANPEPEVTWYKDTTLIQDQGRVSMYKKIMGKDQYMVSVQIANPTEEDGGAWRCNAFNPFGDSNANINLNFEKGKGVPEGYAPIFIDKPTIIPNERGTMITMKVRVKAKPEPTVEWFKDEAKLVEAKRLVIKSHKVTSEMFEFSCIVKKPQASDGGVYKCHIANVFGELNANLNLNIEVAPTIKTQPRVVSIINRKCIIECMVMSSSQPACSWFHMENKVKLDSRHCITVNEDGEGSYKCQMEIMKITKEDAGIYKMIAKNDKGETTSEVIELSADQIEEKPLEKPAEKPAPAPAPVPEKKDSIKPTPPGSKRGSLAPEETDTLTMPSEQAYGHKQNILLLQQENVDTPQKHQNISPEHKSLSLIEKQQQQQHQHKQHPHQKQQQNQQQHQQQPIQPDTIQQYNITPPGHQITIPQNLSQEQLAFLSALKQKHITPETITKMPPEEKIIMEAIQHKTHEQIAHMPSEQLAVLINMQQQYITPETILPILTPEYVATMPPEQQIAIDTFKQQYTAPTMMTDQYQFITPEQATDMAAVQQKYITPEQAAQMSPEQKAVMEVIKQKTPEQIKQMPLEQSEAMADIQQKYITPEQISTMSPDQQADISVVRQQNYKDAMGIIQNQNITPQHVAKIPPEQLKAFQAIQEKYIAPEQIATLTSDQKSAIAAFQQQNKTPIHQHLTPEQLSSVTPRIQDTSSIIPISQIEPVSPVQKQQYPTGTLETKTTDDDQINIIPKSVNDKSYPELEEQFLKSAKPEYLTNDQQQSVIPIQQRQDDEDLANQPKKSKEKRQKTREEEVKPKKEKRQKTDEEYSKEKHEKKERIKDEHPKHTKDKKEKVKEKNPKEIKKSKHKSKMAEEREMKIPRHKLKYQTEDQAKRDKGIMSYCKDDESEDEFTESEQDEEESKHFTKRQKRFETELEYSEIDSEHDESESEFDEKESVQDDTETEESEEEKSESEQEDSDSIQEKTETEQDTESEQEDSNSVHEKIKTDSDQGTIESEQTETESEQESTESDQETTESEHTETESDQEDTDLDSGFKSRRARFLDELWDDEVGKQTKMYALLVDNDNSGCVVLYFSTSSH